MKTVWIASLAIAASTSAFAQSTIYKHVDDSGRITYSNKPMKGAVVMELDPIMVIPATPVATPMAQKTASLVEKTEAKSAAAIMAPVRTSLASIEISRACTR